MRTRPIAGDAVLYSNPRSNMKTHLQRSTPVLRMGILGLLVLLLASGCLSDLRTQVVKRAATLPANEAKGRDLLDRAWRAQGADKMQAKGTYSYAATDTWKGMMGKMGKPWPNAHQEMAFKHDIGSFDAQVDFRSGKRAGEKAGLQSWHYYEVAADGSLAFKKANRRIQFGISAFHYFFELVDRLRNAPLIRHAGQASVRGQQYDLVFVTWDKLEPHRQNDQYLVYVNATTGLVDHCAYTLRQNYLPGAGMLHGSIAFEDFRDVDGVLIPHRQLVYIGGPKRKEKGYVHRFVVRDFRFDGFDPQELYPDPQVAPVGDAKVAEDGK